MLVLDLKDATKEVPNLTSIVVFNTMTGSSYFVENAYYDKEMGMFVITYDDSL